MIKICFITRHRIASFRPRTMPIIDAKHRTDDALLCIWARINPGITFAIFPIFSIKHIGSCGQFWVPHCHITQDKLIQWWSASEKARKEFKCYSRFEEVRGRQKVATFNWLIRISFWIILTPQSCYFSFEGEVLIILFIFTHSVYNKELNVIKSNYPPSGDFKDSRFVIVWF